MMRRNIKLALKIIHLLEALLKCLHFIILVFFLGKQEIRFYESLIWSRGNVSGK